MAHLLKYNPLCCGRGDSVSREAQRVVDLLAPLLSAEERGILSVQSIPPSPVEKTLGDHLGIAPPPQLAEPDLPAASRSAHSFFQRKGSGQISSVNPMYQQSLWTRTPISAVDAEAKVVVDAWQ